MNPASSPRATLVEQRLIHLDPHSGRANVYPFESIVQLLSPGDLVVVNDAATFPASLAVKIRGEQAELRLLPHRPEAEEWEGVLLGAGDWRTRTEERLPPPLAGIGERLEFSGGRSARVTRISSVSPRWIQLAFEGGDAWATIYAQGRPIQYSYLKCDLELWSVQTSYGTKPWASEMPSAGKPLSGALLHALLRRGVEVRTLTHATGLSSTGDAAIDQQLPFPEFYSIPTRTVEAIHATKARGGRVLAVGTSVVRALEGQARNLGGRLEPGFGETDLVIGPAFKRLWVDGILSGVHEMGESHFKLLESFAPWALLAKGLKLAESENLLLHEFGDSTLVL